MTREDWNEGFMAPAGSLPGLHWCAECETWKHQGDCTCERLQQLREEFEAALAAHVDFLVNERGDRHQDVAYFLAQSPEEVMARFEKPDPYPCGPYYQTYLTVVESARRYLIARDFNEFDPGKADMLWKLQRQ